MSSAFGLRITRGALVCLVIPDRLSGRESQN